jgi:formylmethanofuran dehydrogenase subunit E
MGMGNQECLTSQDFQRCVDFHGHVCPGLAIGYRAAKAGMEWLREKRAEDEELVAIVGTDACGADAVQVLTGCTFGKGNFLHFDYGKHTFTLLGRKTGRGVRLGLRPGVMELSERHRRLMERMRENEATGEEKEEFLKLHQKKTQEILGKPLEELFTLKEVRQSLPPKARVERSRTCAQCGEPVMGSKLIGPEGSGICRECFTGSQR